ncbi:MAG: membrane protein [Alphaproteobacteria bacterium]|nr:MAG: membrane protein [Alphaproteobacteria bacterium]
MREPPSFGRRRQPATITIVRDGRAHHFAFNPLLISVAFSLAAMFLVGYLAATAYLIFRDDLIGAAQARHARLIHEYEDRIAALRANLDRVTSRQLLDQQAIEARISELLQREQALRSRSGRIGELVEAARRNGLVKPNATPPPAAPAPATDSLTTGALAPAAPLRMAEAGLVLRGTRDEAPPAAPAQAPDGNDAAATTTLVAAIAGRMAQIDAGQQALLDEIRLAAEDRAARIAGIIDRLDIDLPDDPTERIGGPFIAANAEGSFSSRLAAVDLSLKALDELAGRLETVPLANPVPGVPVSSRFGERIDPFLRRPALHAGIDFSAAHGTPVRATAAGVVIDAGRNGGYGEMVEIDHGGGLTTRYGHLSEVLVRTGDRVEAGTTIGRSGSTGRSTGPHLHYEVRRAGAAVNPMRFLKAGREIARIKAAASG